MPVARQVTLVPDAATWLDEISHWSRECRWPVLIENDVLTPLFIRAFKPERVLRRASVGALPESKAEREQRMEAAVTRAWNGNPDEMTSLAALRAAQLIPPGVAITSAGDDAWPAAVALAAGRGLPLLFVDGDYGAPNETMKSDSVKQLESAIRGAIETTGLSYRALGDSVDAIALCRSVAAKCKITLPPDQSVAIPIGSELNRDDPLSTIDLLGRTDNGSRYGVVGWIFGPSDRAAYMAMCSLFLERGSWWFLSGYPMTDPWSIYAPDEASKLANTVGFTSRATTGEQMSLANWRRLLMGGFDADVLVMNSKGDSATFALFKNDNGMTQDIPFLSRPAALHLIHSWSLTRPGDRWTIGGRLLERGVYAYFGSVQEPALVAFLPPRQLVTRWGGLGPFLIASRYLEGELDRPWRLTAIGDPLMVCIAPAKRTVPTAKLPEARGEDVRAAARERVIRIAKAGDAPDPADFAQAMHDLRMLGEDAPVTSLWKIARISKFASSAAADALPSLFRERNFDEFLAAYRSLERPDDNARDMLWHLAAPRVGSLDAPILDYLRRNLREGDTSIDLAILLPAIDRAKGRSESDRIVEEEMNRTKNEGVRAKLSSLLRR
ncbi:MAG: hypothetical protein JNL80_06745 [Phycisphaerae bacterium]|nr:hypothetical protein [Phycisphaerae bacterium]